jgi:hypothetical protein
MAAPIRTPVNRPILAAAPHFAAMTAISFVEWHVIVAAERVAFLLERLNRHPENTPTSRDARGQT